MAHLGGDRFQRVRSREGGARDPPGHELRLRGPLHRRPARARARRRHPDRGPGRLPLLPRRHALRAGGDRPQARRLRGHLRAAEGRRHPPRQPLPGVGLHGGERPERLFARAGDAGPGLRDARRHDDGRPGRPGRRAPVHRHLDGELHPGREQPDRAPRHRHLRGAVLHGPRLRARGASPTSIPAASRAATGPGRRRSPARSRASGSTAPLRCRCARTSSATACSAT